MTNIIADKHTMSTDNARRGVGPAVDSWQASTMSIGGRIREARKAKRMKGLELAKAIGTTGGTLSHWEHNQRVPRSEYASALAKALGVSERWLITGERLHGDDLHEESSSPLPENSQKAFSERQDEATPSVGLTALEAVLFSHEWPDFPMPLVDEMERSLRAEAMTSAGKLRSASAWRLRLRQITEVASPKVGTRRKLVSVS